MSGDLSELDQINETDIIEAFNGEDTTLNEEVQTDDSTQETPSSESLEAIEEITNIPDELLDGLEETSLENDEVSQGEILDNPGEIEILPMAEIESALEDQEEESVELSSSSLNELTNILSKLLNNKTIEITIKIKD